MRSRYSTAAGQNISSDSPLRPTAGVLQLFQIEMRMLGVSSRLATVKSLVWFTQSMAIAPGHRR